MSVENDVHNNFRPEEQYENGREAIWGIQYSRNDGTVYGNLNFSNRLIVPCIPKVHDSGNDFYKPSHNLVDAYRTNSDGLPLLDDFATTDYAVGTNQTVDPRLFVTVGLPGTPYMFNTNFMMDETNTWSRGGGAYGYFVSLKQNVDPELTDIYLFNCDNQWASSMNRIVFRYADVLLMRAEAYAQLGQTAEAIAQVNLVRQRAANMMNSSIVATYPNKYGIHYAVGKYNGSYSKEEAMKIVKMERRLELAMESERFFDLVRWGDAVYLLTALPLGGVGGGLLTSCSDDDVIGDPEKDWAGTATFFNPTDETGFSTYYNPAVGRCGDPMPFFDKKVGNFKVLYLQEFTNNATYRFHPIWGISTTDGSNYESLGEIIPVGSNDYQQDAALGTGCCYYNEKDGLQRYRPLHLGMVPLPLGWRHPRDEHQRRCWRRQRAQLVRSPCLPQSHPARGWYADTG